MWLWLLLFFVGVLEEAEFYNIAELIRLIKQQIDERDTQPDAVSDWYGIYCIILNLLATCSSSSSSSSSSLPDNIPVEIEAMFLLKEE